MKTFTILFLTLCSFTAQAQIVAYNNAAQNAFYSIGGYSFTEGYIPDGIQISPYVRSGPSPQNDFSYAVSADGGIQHVYTYISTLNVNKSIKFEFKSNNVRKFGCKTTAVNIPTGQATNEVIIFTAYSNQGNFIATTGALTDFVGFVTGNENEYITLITATFASSSTNSIAINNIIIGNNTPQNSALNFDGVDDYVSIPSTVGNFTTNQDFTVECWVKPDPTQTTQSGANSDENDIFGKWAGLSAGVNNNYPFVIRYLNQNRTNVAERGRIRVGQWDGTNFPIITSTTAVNDGRWHHVAFVKMGTLLKLYIDGVQEGVDVTDNASNATNNTTPLQFGRRGNNESYFKGEIDEVRIWSIAKTSTEIQTNRFCKDPDSNFMVASYNGSNGVPHGNNTLITQLPDVIGLSQNGTLNNFAKIGDASNFVTGQVKYVKSNATGSNNGSSWTNAFTNLHSALTASTCNDLFDVYVAKGIYKPTSGTNTSVFFNIPSNMKIYGGFEGIEKSINQRNMSLIYTTNKTTLNGDINDDDIPFDFSNRNDNASAVVVIAGNNVVFDGFVVRGGSSSAIHMVTGFYGDLKINNCKLVDNTIGVFSIEENLIILNSVVSGNKYEGFLVLSNPLNIQNCLITNNGRNGIYSGSSNATITNSTIISNGGFGINMSPSAGSLMTNLIKNSIIYDNNLGGIQNTGTGSVTNTITNSLVQGETSTANGNLNGNTVNPQFVNPLTNSVISDLGNYRLKDSSPCINVGTDDGVSPFDLERNLRPKGGKTDMGAYESNINMNEIISIATGNWESNTTWNLDRIPLPTDKVILNGHTLTVTTNTARAKDLEYNTGAILRYLSGGLLRFGL